MNFFQSLVAFRNGAKLDTPLLRQIAYQHYVTRRRPYWTVYAYNRQVFCDFFPQDHRNLKAEVYLATMFGRQLEVNNYATPTELFTRPLVLAQTFHEHLVPYTFVMLDADKVRGQLRSEEILYLVQNVQLSATQTQVQGDVVLDYLPPHPTRGSIEHRFLSFLFEQPKLQSITCERDCRVWDLVKLNSWIPRGLHLIMTEWDPTVTHIYKQIFKTNEPIYGDPQGKIKTKARNVYPTGNKSLFNV